MGDSQVPRTSHSGYDAEDEGGPSYQLPWGQQPTPQDRGRKREKSILKKLGARAHPGSGSGKIQFDGSTPDELIEVKTAERSHTLSAKYIERLYTTAVRQGKLPKMIVEFPKFTLTIIITRRP